jgi:hypothetical protein
MQKSKALVSARIHTILYCQYKANKSNKYCIKLQVKILAWISRDVTGTEIYRAWNMYSKFNVYFLQSK